MNTYYDEWLTEKVGGMSNIDRCARKRIDGNHVSMREQRVLDTHLLARAWTKLCDTVDFTTWPPRSATTSRWTAPATT